MGKFKNVSDELLKKAPSKRLHGASTFEFLCLNFKSSAEEVKFPTQWATPDHKVTISKLFGKMTQQRTALLQILEALSQGLQDGQDFDIATSAEILQDAQTQLKTLEQLYIAFLEHGDLYAGDLQSAWPIVIPAERVQLCHVIMFAWTTAISYRSSSGKTLPEDSSRLVRSFGLAYDLANFHVSVAVGMCQFGQQILLHREKPSWIYKVYRLLQDAAGYLAKVEKQLVPLLALHPRGDCNARLLRLWRLVMMADAQVRQGG